MNSMKWQVCEFALGPGGLHRWTIYHAGTGRICGLIRGRCCFPPHELGEYCLVDGRKSVRHASHRAPQYLLFLSRFEGSVLVYL